MHAASSLEDDKNECEIVSWSIFCSAAYLAARNSTLASSSVKGPDVT